MNPLLRARDYVFAVVLLALVVGFLIYRSSLISEGEDRVKGADQVARQEQKVKDDADTERMRVAADAASKESGDAKKSLADYMLAHPVGTVLVRRPSSDHRPVTAGNSTSTGGAACTSAGQPTGSEVSNGSKDETVDIGPELDTIVLSFGTVARLYRQCQEQPRPSLN